MMDCYCNVVNTDTLQIVIEIHGIEGLPSPKNDSCQELQVRETSRNAHGLRVRDQPLSQDRDSYQDLHISATYENVPDSDLYRELQSRSKESYQDFHGKVTYQDPEGRVTQQSLHYKDLDRILRGKLAKQQLEGHHAQQSANHREQDQLSMQTVQELIAQHNNSGLGDSARDLQESRDLQGSRDLHEAHDLHDSAQGLLSPSQGLRFSNQDLQSRMGSQSHHYRESSEDRWLSSADLQSRASYQISSLHTSEEDLLDRETFNFQNLQSMWQQRHDEDPLHRRPSEDLLETEQSDLQDSGYQAPSDVESMPSQHLHKRETSRYLWDRESLGRLTITCFSQL